MFALLAGGVFVVSAVAVYAIPGLGDSVEEDVTTGQEVPTGQVAYPSITPGPPGMSIEDAYEFTDFQLYWAGENFSGLPITRIIRRISTPPAAAGPLGTPQDSVDFYYGDCEATSEEPGCHLPLTLIVEPTCTRAALTPDGIERGELTTLRGVPVRVLDGAVVVWTEEVTITMSAPPESPITPIDAVNGLERVTEVVRSPVDLPTPDFSSCD